MATFTTLCVNSFLDFKLAYLPVMFVQQFLRNSSVRKMTRGKIRVELNSQHEGIIVLIFCCHHVAGLSQVSD